jgi:cell division protein FtsW
MGLVQVYSSSYFQADENFGNGYFYLIRQVGFVISGSLIAFGIFKIKEDIFVKYGWWIWILGSVALALTLIPGLGIKVGGASRWLPLFAGLRFEPGEFLKLGFCFWLAALFSSKETVGFHRLNWYSLLLLTMAPFGLILIQPDFGTFSILVLLFLVVVFALGLKIKCLILTLSTIIPVFYFLVMSVGYRRQRILAYLDPWIDPQGKGYQVIQSMVTFSRGGIFGEGLGYGQGKLFFLPEAHTDFTFAVFGEEWGFIGVFFLLGLYFLIPLFGLKLSNKIENLYKKILVLSLVMMMTFSSLINIGVSLGILPTKGLTLPFLSYGGSSLIMLSLAFGLLIRYERQEHLT